MFVLYNQSLAGTFVNRRQEKQIVLQIGANNPAFPLALWTNHLEVSKSPTSLRGSLTAEAISRTVWETAASQKHAPRRDVDMPMFICSLH